MLLKTKFPSGHFSLTGITRRSLPSDTPIGHDHRPWPHRPLRRKHPCSSGCPPAHASGGRNWTGVDVRFRGAFAYVTARLPDGDTMPLMRLRYGGSAARWGFAVYLASNERLPRLGPADRPHFAGAPEDALDTACGLYLGDPTAWT